MSVIVHTYEVFQLHREHHDRFLKKFLHSQYLLLFLPHCDQSQLLNLYCLDPLI